MININDVKEALRILKKWKTAAAHKKEAKADVEKIEKVIRELSGEK